MTTIESIIQQGLDALEANDLMRTPHKNMPPEMIDDSKQQNDDWIPWKPIPSTISDQDVIDWEKELGYTLPPSYKRLLQYKHFYELSLKRREVNFFSCCVRDWKLTLRDHIFQSWYPDELIGKGYIYFADWEDWGILCFDTSSTQDEEYPIVLFDHEDMHIDHIAANLLELLTAPQETILRRISGYDHLFE